MSTNNMLLVVVLMSTNNILLVLVLFSGYDGFFSE